MSQIIPAGDEGASDEALQEAPQAVGRRRLRRLHLHVGIWSLVVLLLFSVFVMLASMSLSGRVIVLPDRVTRAVQDRLNEDLPAGSVTVQQVEFGVTPKGRPRLRLINVGLRDETGLDVAQLNAVEGGVKVRPLLQGRLEPSLLSLSGAQVTLRRLSDGSFALSFGQVRTSGSLSTVLDAMNRAFTTGFLAEAERIEAHELTITLEDARSGRIWQVTDGQMKVSQTDTLVDITVSFAIFNQTEDLAETVISLRSAKGSSEASLAATFQNAAAADIAAQTPALAFLEVLDAPVSGALRSSIGADGSVGELAGMLTIGAGALSPSPGAAPVAFDGAKAYVSYDPLRQRVELAQFSVDSSLGHASGDGYADLHEFNRGFPEAFEGQIRLTEASFTNPDLYEVPLSFSSAWADMRLRLDPFTLDLGQVVAQFADSTLHASGQIAASRKGWAVDLDAGADRLGVGEVLALWPQNAATKPRDWVSRNVFSGAVTNAQIALRKAPGEEPQITAGWDIAGGRMRPIKTFPEVEMTVGYATIHDHAMTVVAEKGQMTAPSGDILDASGTVFRIPDMRVKQPGRAETDLVINGALTGALSLLALEPTRIFRSGRYGPDMAQGQVHLAGTFRHPLAKTVTVDEIDYDLDGWLRDVTSDQLVPGRVLRADELEVHASENGVEVAGPIKLDGMALNGRWQMPMTSGEAGASTVTGSATLSHDGLAGLGIDLPAGWLSGAARADFTLALPIDGDPELTLTSDLAGLGVSLSAIGWSLPRAGTGSLEIRATLGDRAEITALSFTAPGLTLGDGRLTLNDDGGLDTARFGSVSIGRWYDGALTVTGRGAGRPVALSLDGGTMDLREMPDLSASGASAGAGSGPLTVALDRLRVTNDMVLNNLRGDLTYGAGLSGSFAATVAGGGDIRGTLVTQAEGLAIRITSDHAGAVLRNAGIYRSAQGGALDLILTPTGAPGTWEGEATIDDVRIVDAGAMAELLSALSIVGLLEQLDQSGIAFNKTKASFRIDPKTVTLKSLSAVGGSMGVSLDGWYHLDTRQIDMQGVLSPVYILNGLGRIVSPRDGEGLIGFNFTLTGPVDDPEIGVNPLSVLTPGFLRDLFRRPNPSPDDPAETTSE